MEYNTHTDTMLSELLDRFIKKETLTPELLVMSQEYLSGQTSHLPLFKNTELHETVLYLKETMDINNLHTIYDLINYYTNKRKSISKHIDTISAQLNKNENDSFTYSNEIKWEKVNIQASISDTKHTTNTCSALLPHTDVAPLLPVIITYAFSYYSNCISIKKQIEQTEDQILK